MRSGVLILLLLTAFVVLPAAGLAGIVPVPPNTLVPTDPDADGLYDDVNGNDRADFADVVLYFNQMAWISANEPVGAFDYNNNGRIDFADVVSLFNELGTGPAPTPSVLISRTISPSAEDQVISGGGINLTIPGGALDQTSLVRVATVPAPPSPPAGTGNLTVYDITIGSQTQFNQSLGIEIPYDPATIPAGTSPSRAIQGVWWDVATHAWHEVPTAVDESRKVVVIAPDHLTPEGYTVVREPRPVTEIETDHFVVHYDPSDDAVIAKQWDGWGNYTTARSLANRVSFALNKMAYDFFVTEHGFRPPPASRFSSDNKIHVDVGDYDSSSWNPFTKTISVARGPFIPGEGAPARLDIEMRHELFHAVQNAYVWTTWMDMNRWWIEATAEYASTYLWTYKPDTSFPLDAAFFDKSLWTVNGNHEYQSAHFVDEMLDHWPEDFRDLWTASTGPLPAYDAVDAWGQLKHSRSLEAVYRDLMVANLTLTGSPRDSGSHVRQSILDAAVPFEGLTTFNVVTGSRGEGAVTSAFKVSTTEESVWLMDARSGWPPTLPKGVQVTRFVAHPHGTFEYDFSSDGQKTHQFGPSGFAAGDGDVIFYTVVNCGETVQNTLLALTQPDAHISPEAATVVAGSSVPYTVSVDNVPFGLEVRVTDGGGHVCTSGHSSTDGTVTLPPFGVLFPNNAGVYKQTFYASVAGAWSKEFTVHVTVIDPPGG